MRHNTISVQCTTAFGPFLEKLFSEIDSNLLCSITEKESVLSVTTKSKKNTLLENCDSLIRFNCIAYRVIWFSTEAEIGNAANAIRICRHRWNMPTSLLLMSSRQIRDFIIRQQSIWYSKRCTSTTVYTSCLRSYNTNPRMNTSWRTSYA